MTCQPWKLEVVVVSRRDSFSRNGRLLRTEYKAGYLSCAVSLLALQASKSDSAPPRGEAWEPDSLRAQSQRRDVVSMVEMMNIACGETEQSFHLNASTYTTTGNPLLLFLTTRALPCPIRKRLLLTQSHHRFARVPALHHNTTTRTAWSSNHTDRQSL